MISALFWHGYMQEVQAFQTLMGDLFTAIESPDTVAFEVYAAAIIGRTKRDDILDFQQSSKKKRALLTAVEAQIELRPTVYYEFLEILSKDPSMSFICQKMKEKCGNSCLCINSYSLFAFTWPPGSSCLRNCASLLL